MQRRNRRRQKIQGKVDEFSWIILIHHPQFIIPASNQLDQVQGKSREAIDTICKKVRQDKETEQRILKKIGDKIPYQSDMKSEHQRYLWSMEIFFQPEKDGSNARVDMQIPTTSQICQTPTSYSEKNARE